MKALPVLALGLGVALLGFSAPVAQANNFTPEKKLIRSENSISLEKALERNSTRFGARRPGLGAFTRRARQRTRTSEQQVQGSERRIRKVTRRLGGGRNGYARYLRSLETGNANKVSRLRRGRVTPDQRADTEANTR